MREPDAVTDEVARVVVDAAIEVHRHLGPGLLEEHYKDALALELRGRGLRVEREVRVPVIYKGAPLGRHYALDLLVDDLVIVEAKASRETVPVHVHQLLSYLRMTGHAVGLLLNFHAPLMKHGITRVVNSRDLAPWRLGAEAAATPPAVNDPGRSTAASPARSPPRPGAP